MRRLGLALFISAVASPFALAGSPIVISQIYSNFIELFNSGSTTTSVDGWSVQFKFGAASWQSISIAGKLAPGQHYLVQAGTSPTAVPPDATGSFLFGTLQASPNGLTFSGSVALVPNKTLLSNPWPSTTDVVDLFGYGQTFNYPELAASGLAFPSFLPGSSASRRNQGCLNSGNNAADFQTATVFPHNSRAPLAPCTATPLVQENGVLNAASNVSGAVAPGEILTILGSNLGPSVPAASVLSPDGTHVTASLGGVQVVFDGVAAPMLYVSATRLNVVAPFALAGKTSTVLQVQYNGLTSNQTSLTIAASAPAIFTERATGSGPAVALNQDSTINSSSTPANPGSVVVLYATGAGQTSAPGEDGKITAGNPPKPILKVAATVNGTDAAVLSAANAPGSVSGIIQVSLRIPGNAAGRLSVQLMVGNNRSPEVTLSAPLENDAAPQEVLNIAPGAADIAYDPGIHRLYAAIGGNAPSNANSIAVIDPSSGQVLHSIPTETNPHRLALSDDGHFLYISVHGFPGGVGTAIQRIDLHTGTPDFVVEIANILPEIIVGSPLEVLDLHSLPGEPRSLQIVSNQQSPVAIIDDTVRRPKLGPPAFTAVPGAPGILWADTRMLFVDRDGVTAGPLYPAATCPTIQRTFELVPGLNVLVSSDSLVMPTPPHGLVAELPIGFSSQFTYRPDTGLLYALDTGGSLFAFDPSSWLLTAGLSLHAAVGIYGPPTRLISVGSAGLATVALDRTYTSRVIIIPLSTIRPFAPFSLPAPQSDQTKLRRFSIPNVGLTADQAGSHIYLSTPNGYPTIGNSIIDFDVTAGTVAPPIWVGSEPGAGAVSSDGQFLHTVLGGPRKLVRLALPGLNVDKQFDIKDDNDALVYADTVLSLPFDPKSVALGRICGGAQGIVHTKGFVVYDDGVRRRNATTTYGDIPSSLAGLPLVNEAQLSDDGFMLFGMQGEISGARMSRWQITPDGFQLQLFGPILDDDTPYVIDGQNVIFGGGFYMDIRCQQARCLTRAGDVVDETTLARITRVQDPANSHMRRQLVQMDLDNNRLFILGYDGADTIIEMFNATTYVRTGRFQIPQFYGLFAFQRVSEQLAMTNGTELVMLPISLIKP